MTNFRSLIRTSSIMLTLMLSSAIAFSQSDETEQQAERDREAAQMKAFIQGLGWEPTSVKVMLRDLTVKEGKIVFISDDSFILRIKGPDEPLISIGVKRIPPDVWTIKYSKVLWIKGDGKSLSLIPNNYKRPHGFWADVTAIASGSRVAVLLANGEWAVGLLYYADDLSVSLINKKGSKRIEIPRPELRALYGITPKRGGFKKGAAAVAGDQPISDGIGAVIVGLAALTGGIVGQAMKSEGDAMLVYSL